MVVFAWRRRETRHFGSQWVPFAELKLKSSRGRWRTFAVQVDPGAVVSVLTRSAADLLEIEHATGQPIDLAGVAGPGQRYRLHLLPAQIGDFGEFTMHVAFAEREDVPNLLGRLDVLDRFQIDLDPSLEETRLSAPWLDARGRALWRHFVEVEAVVLQKWREHPLPGRVDEAARRFLNRADQLFAAGAGLLKLQRAFEIPLVLRSLFELSVQFEYLMLDAEPRAALFLDFEHVTKQRIVQAWLNLPGTIGRRLRESPMRPAGERRNLEAYNRVRHQYAASGDGTRVRARWYPGTLRDIARVVGRTQEYDAVYGLYSAWAHGDPWTSGRLEPAHGRLSHLFAYWARLLIRIADAKKIVLPGVAYESLVLVAQGPTRPSSE